MAWRQRKISRKLKFASTKSAEITFSTFDRGRNVVHVDFNKPLNIYRRLQRSAKQPSAGLGEVGRLATFAGL